MLCDQASNPIRIITSRQPPIRIRQIPPHNDITIILIECICQYPAMRSAGVSATRYTTLDGPRVPHPSPAGSPGRSQ